MSPTVDADLYHEYRAKHPDEHERWWAWVRDVMGTEPDGLHITRVTLGEGVLEVERLVEPFKVVDEEIVTTVETYPAPIPPPCWPR